MQKVHSSMMWMLWGLDFCPCTLFDLQHCHWHAPIDVHGLSLCNLCHHMVTLSHNLYVALHCIAVYWSVCHWPGIDVNGLGWLHVVLCLFVLVGGEP